VAALLAFAVAMGMTLPGLAWGATISVTTIDDELTGDGKCSLREAISAANDDSTGPGGDCAKGSGADTVSVPDGHFTLGIAVIEDANAGGDLDVLSNLTIAGAGAGATTIDANRIDRVVEVRPGRVVTIRAVTITGGKAPDGSNGFNQTGTPGAPDGGDADPGDGHPGSPGGGIFNNAGSLTLVDSAVTDNVAGAGGRGGIAHGGDGATASNGGNGGEAHGGQGGAGGDGGGIDTTGVLKLTRVSVTGNKAGAGGAGGPSTGGQGGGATTGAGGDGGDGFFGEGGPGGRGGGIGESGGGSLESRRSAISQNSAGTGGPGAFGQGGAGGVSGGTSGAGGAGGTGQGGIGGTGGAGGGVSAIDPAVLAGDLISGNAAGAPGRGGNGTGGIGGASTGGAASVSGDGGNAFSGQAGFDGSGGGVSLTGSVVNSTITANIAGAGADAGNATGGKGGGSVSGSGGDGGGGFAAQTGDGGLGGSGGGLYTEGNLTISHATLTANGVGAGGAAGIATAGAGGAAPTPGSPGTVSPGTPGSPGSGGGENALFTGATTLTNSIVAGNAAPSCSGAVADGGHDISFGDSSCPGVDADPKLGALANNGGPTQTQALLSGSPAINGVPASGAGCPATDQRGVARPRGVACDIGAYEHAPPGVVTGRASGVAAGGAKLAGQVNPNARATSYHFELGKTTAHGTSTASRTLSGRVDAVAVAAKVAGLAPATTYHYRLVATNADGTNRGRDRTFTIPAKASFAGSKSSIRVDRDDRFKFSFHATPGLRGSATFKSVTKVRVSRRSDTRKRVTLARKSFTVPARGKVTLRIGLSEKALRILKLNGTIRTRVTVTLKNKAGLNSTASKRITLRAPEPHRR
jgi:CSLREA domain-containing protein